MNENTTNNSAIQRLNHFNDLLFCSDNTKFTTLLRHEDSLLAVGIASGSHISVVSLTEDGVQISQLSVPAAWADDHTRYVN